MGMSWVEQRKWKELWRRKLKARYNVIDNGKIIVLGTAQRLVLEYVANDKVRESEVLNFLGMLGLSYAKSKVIKGLKRRGIVTNDGYYLVLTEYGEHILQKMRQRYGKINVDLLENALKEHNAEIIDKMCI